MTTWGNLHPVLFEAVYRIILVVETKKIVNLKSFRQVYDEYKAVLGNIIKKVFL